VNASVYTGQIRKGTKPADWPIALPNNTERRMLSLTVGGG
jgi:hypothetical protein